MGLFPGCLCFCPQVVDLLDEMVALGVAPTTGAYGLALAACLDSRDWERLEQLLEDVKKSPLKVRPGRLEGEGGAGAGGG
jgi:hypothetical protein